MVRWLIQAHLNVTIAQPQFTENRNRTKWNERSRQYTKKSRKRNELSGKTQKTHADTKSTQRETLLELTVKPTKKSKQHNESSRQLILRIHGNATSNHEKTPKNNENTKTIQSKTL